MSDTVSIEQEIKKSYLEYSLTVIIGRAIPDVRDGLKPVHRRILFSMHEQGNSHTRSYKKSAHVVGDVMGKYHPHGDQAIYDALVRMAQPFSMRDMLVDGQGNFGSIDGDSAAAMRYTEVRMTRLTSNFLADIEKNTVDYRPTYDSANNEPVVLPTKVPNLLLNGSSGIAVGMATNIPPHNLGELLDGLEMLLDNPDTSVKDLMTVIKGPDFPTNAFVYAGQGLYDAYTTGRGTVKVRGRLEVEEKKKNRQSIVVTEIPYALNKSVLVEKIAALVNEKKIEGISDLRDESNRKGIRIVMDLKKGSIPEIIINSLYKFTQLETSFGINMLAVVGNRPQLLNLKQILAYFLEHRREVVIRRTRFDLDKAERQAHILEGYQIALDHIDEIVALIRASATPAEAKERLMERFGLSEIQSKAILDMRLQRLTGLERDKIIAEYKEILKTIEYLRSILEQEAVLVGVIRDEFKELRKTHATPRRTEVLEEALEGIDVEDLIPDDDVVITLSRRGYIKRTSLDNYQQQKRGGKGIAAVHTGDGDFVQNFCTTSNHQFLLLFTNKGRMHQLKVHQVPLGSRVAKGVHIANLLPLDKDEHVATAMTIREFSPESYLFFVTKKGMVKRSSLDLYSKSRRTGILAVGLREDDELIMVRTLAADSELVLVTENGLSIRFVCKDVRPMGRTAVGVKGIALRQGDNVVSAVVVDEELDTEIMTISRGGYGKRTQLDLYRVQTRGGKGIISMKVTPKTGKVLGATVVAEDHEIILLTSGNKLIRLPVKDISTMGRATQGVRLVRLDQGGEAVGFDLVREHEQEDDE